MAKNHKLSKEEYNYLLGLYGSEFIDYCSDANLEPYRLYEFDRDTIDDLFSSMSPYDAFMTGVQAGTFTSKSKHTTFDNSVLDIDASHFYFDEHHDNNVCVVPDNELVNFLDSIIDKEQFLQWLDENGYL